MKGAAVPFITAELAMIPHRTNFVFVLGEKCNFKHEQKKLSFPKCPCFQNVGIYIYIFFVEILIYKSRRYDSSLSLRNFQFLWYKYLIVFEKAFFIFETWLFCRSLLIFCF